MTKQQKAHTLRGTRRQTKALEMFVNGTPIREIAKRFGVSYEWTRRVVTGVRY